MKHVPERLLGAALVAALVVAGIAQLLVSRLAGVTHVPWAARDGTTREFRFRALASGIHYLELHIAVSRRSGLRSPSPLSAGRGLEWELRRDGVDVAKGALLVSPGNRVLGPTTEGAVLGSFELSKGDEYTLVVVNTALTPALVGRSGYLQVAPEPGSLERYVGVQLVALVAAGGMALVLSLLLLLRAGAWAIRRSRLRRRRLGEAE